MTTAFVRAYTERPAAKPRGTTPGQKDNDSPSDWSLVFDCETTTCAAQALRFGFFQVRKDGELKREGIFIADELPDDERNLVASYASDRTLEVCSVQEFRHKVLLRVGYEARANIIGFNLPFDISRVAMDWGEARGSLRGGFSFQLSEDRHNPRIRIKHLSASAALIDFAAPGKQLTPGGMRNRGLKVRPHRGFFCDVKTLASALLSRKHSLASLCEGLDVETPKRVTDEHGGPLTADYLDYARADVQATWECFVALREQYKEHNLATPLHRIASEASVGKAYLKAMGVKSFMACQPDASRGDFGTIMSTYFGGRAEVRIRKSVTQVYYCDFKSMYPTVNALMGLWSFLTADGYTQKDTTEETQALLDRITLDDIQDPQTWRRITTIVRLKPKQDVLPLRTRYTRDKDNLIIGLNVVSSDLSLNYTLADLIASKLLTGKTPQIEQAITYRPGDPQSDLKPIRIFGRFEYQIDPMKDDVFVGLVDMRDEAKARKDPLEEAIKIIANATCYGIFVEVIRDDAPKPEPLMVYGPDGVGFESQSNAIEQPGNFFNPLLATLITGAARLMLATAEKLAADQGLDWVFCDTDSIAMARPDDMEETEFHKRANAVIDWFEPLNPYRKQGSILKAEDQNFEPNSKRPMPLYCYAISAKRYALFNIENGIPVIRKLSAHGLGQWMPPYEDDNPANGISDPAIPLEELGVKRWIYDFWFQIIRAAIAGHPNHVLRNYHPNLELPAIMRYGATSPALLRWMRHFNAEKPYREQVKPFGFLISLPPRIGAFARELKYELVETIRRGRPCKNKAPKPIAQFEKDPAKAAALAFDRETGEPVPGELLKTYAEALALYHVSPEDKFENGGPWDAGRTERRHLRITDRRLIGKEANKVGEAGEPDPVIESCVTFARAPKSQPALN